MEEIHIAAEAGDVRKLEEILDAGIDVNKKVNTYGQVALHYAAMGGHLEAMAFLLDRGANLRATDENGDTALHWAVSSTRMGAVLLLLDRGASLKASNKLGETPLHTATVNGRVDDMTLLLDRGADPTVATEAGWTALHMTASRGHVEATALLLDRGADLSARNKNGRSALDLAREYGRKPTVKYLEGRMRGGSSAGPVSSVANTKQATATSSTSTGAHSSLGGGRGRGTKSGAVKTVSVPNHKGPIQAATLSSSNMTDLQAQLSHKDAQLSVLLRSINSLARIAKCGQVPLAPDSSVDELVATTQAVEEALSLALGTHSVSRPLNMAAFLPDLPPASVTHEATQANALGGGASGRVFGGKLELDVAVKVVSPSFSGAVSKDAFKLDTSAVCCFSHPNIVRLYGVVSEAGLIVMERLEKSLSAEIAESRRGSGGETAALDPERLRGLSLDIARGMAHVHACGFVHSDLKATNVLIDRSGRAKVSDVGLARKPQNMGAPTFPKGANAYVAPEVWNEKTHGPPADVYAFAMTLYHMLRGQDPWSELDMADVPEYVTGGARPPIESYMDDRTVAMMERCWAQAPEERPTFAVLVAELERV